MFTGRDCLQIDLWAMFGDLSLKQFMHILKLLFHLLSAFIGVPAEQGKRPLVTTGRDLFGHSIDPVVVLYIDNEMTEDDVVERLDEFGYGPDTDLSRLCYTQYPPMPPLDTAAGGEALIAEITALGAQLVVIDTLSKVVDGEENSSDTFLAFARHTGSRLRSLGVAGLFLDHTGKDISKGARGSSAKNDHVDAVYKLTQRDRGIVHLELTHRRIGWLDSLTLRRTADEHLIRFDVTETQAVPAGVINIADVLSDLGAIADLRAGELSANDADRLLRDNGHKFRRTNILAAVRYLKQTQGGSRNHRNYPDPY